MQTGREIPRPQRCLITWRLIRKMHHSWRVAEAHDPDGRLVAKGESSRDGTGERWWVVGENFKREHS